MPSETEAFLQPIPLTNHAQYCKYPCWCMTGPGTEAQRAYQENLRTRMTTGQLVDYTELEQSK